MTVVVNHLGRKGAAGEDGTDGQGIAGIRLSKLYQPLLNAIKPNNISDSLTLDRNGEALFNNRYGNEEIIPGDFITYILRDSNDFETGNWITQPTFITIDNTNSTSPFGTDDATQITFADTTGGFQALEAMIGTVDYSDNKLYRVSFYIKLVSGTIDNIETFIGTASSTEPTIITDSITSDWQRITTTVSSGVTAGGYLSFMPITEGCTIQVYEFQVTEGIGLYPVVTTEDNTPLLLPTYVDTKRVNQDGLFIEGAKTNLCTNSQNLNSWQVTGATPSSISGLSQDFFNGSSGVIAFTTSQSVQLSQSDLNLTVGNEYAVSFYTKYIGGEIDSAFVSLGGDLQVFDITSTLSRVSIKLTAETTSIIFNLVSSNSTASVIITGVQIESGETTSYIPTGFSESIRPAEKSAIDIDPLSDMTQPFSLLASVRNLSVTESDAYLFNIGGELFAYALNGSLYVNNNLVDAFSGNSDALITYDGADINVYINGAFAYNETVSFSAKPNYFYLGSSNDEGLNPINANVKNLQWWDFEITADEARAARAN